MGMKYWDPYKIKFDCWSFDSSGQWGVGNPNFIPLMTKLYPLYFQFSQNALFTIKKYKKKTHKILNIADKPISSLSPGTKETIGDSTFASYSPFLSLVTGQIRRCCHN